MSKVYIFHRGDHWYPLELRDDDDAIENAQHNPGTTKVTDSTKRVIWPLDGKPKIPVSYEIKRLAEFKWKDIKQATAEGALIARGISLLCWARFPDKKPEQVLEFMKDTILNPLINEPVEETFKRLEAVHQSKNN